MTELTPEQKLKMMEEALKLDRAKPAYQQKSPPKYVAPVPVPKKHIKDLENYILLPQAGGNGWLVSKTRSFLGSEWDKAYENLKIEGCYMLTPRQFVDFLNMLKSEQAVYDGNGKEIPQQEAKALFDDITGENTNKGEWLNARFDNSGRWYIKTDHGTLLINDLELCLMEDRGVDDKPGIDLDDWLANANSQGMPQKDAKEGNVRYLRPRNKAAACFYVNSDGRILNCSTHPRHWSIIKGVRKAIPVDEVSR